jgi:predicted dienelactone hydrolase
MGNNARLIRFTIVIAFALLSTHAQASMGLVEIESSAGHGPVTVFYPSSGEVKRVERGPFSLDVAWQGVPARGNGRLVVISHGSPASPWVYSDLARTLVEAGFIVAMPEHFADNYKNDSEPGPPSWKRRPLEVSHAIDAVGLDARFAPLLNLDKVGMYGMSAGGHTALTLAGGRWSPARLKQHCEENLAEDFQACVGLSTQLSGGMLDGLKIRIARWVISAKPTDTAWYSHTDPRIAAIVAGVPLAADFDAASLASPRIPLGIVTARGDKWLLPKFHSDRILQACSTCERVADLETGGHGALMSPLWPGRSGLIADLIDDPPGFDRARVVPEVNQKIARFFQRHLGQLDLTLKSTSPPFRQSPAVAEGKRQPSR